MGIGRGCLALGKGKNRGGSKVRNNLNLHRGRKDQDGAEKNLKPRIKAKEPSKELALA